MKWDSLQPDIQERVLTAVANDRPYLNAVQNSDAQNAGIELDAALQRAIRDEGVALSPQSAGQRRGPGCLQRAIPGGRGVETGQNVARPAGGTGSGHDDAGADSSFRSGRWSRLDTNGAQDHRESGPCRRIHNRHRSERRPGTAGGRLGGRVIAGDHQRRPNLEARRRTAEV